MATVITTTFTDDLDGAALDREDVALVEWSWSGVHYVLETSRHNIHEIEHGTTPFATVLAQSRRAESPSADTGVGPHRRTPDSQSMTIRRWARLNGHLVHERGRISTVVLTAFAATH